jgi:hypothetical protein
MYYSEDEHTSMVRVMMLCIRSFHTLIQLFQQQQQQKSLLSISLPTTISETYSIHGADFLIYWADYVTHF